jgi:hypothetical protein
MWPWDRTIGTRTRETERSVKVVILDKFPLWAVYLGTVAVVLVAAEIGFRIGLWRQRRDPSSAEAPITGAVVGGMLGLMAFVLGFSIGIVIDQHGDRKAFSPLAREPCRMCCGR